MEQKIKSKDSSTSIQTEDQKIEIREIKARATDEARRGVYTNVAVIIHNKREFMISFFFQTPEETILLNRIITNPEHAKRLAKAITENVSKYEENFGEISLEHEENG